MKKIVFLAGCISVMIASTSYAVPAQPHAPTPVVQPVISDLEYRVQPEDVLQITVYEEPGLATTARVTGSGEINFPLLGRVSVGGLSIIDVQEKITALLDDGYLVNPQVQVFIETYHIQNVFVTGSVNRPGSYPLPPGKPTTVMEAIAMAGGFYEDAAVNQTRIIRIQNGVETTLNIKAKEIMKGDKGKDLQVLPHDVVFVPESIF
jgi:polysaccharide biosynthesis/export protein